jgi:hypothetical protein
MERDDLSSIRERMKRFGQDTTANGVLDSILAGPKVRWRRADLNPRLRHRIHLNAAEVPRFPHDDLKLTEPRNWPATMTIEGVLCSLTVYVYEPDGRQGVYSRVLPDDGTPVVLHLYYTDPGTDFHSDDVRHCGPFGRWLSGRLAYRSWTKGRGSHSRVWAYWPYPSGELFSFGEHDMKFDAQGHGVSGEDIEETFARNGTLIGCCAGPVNRGGTCGGYWMGADVGEYYILRWGEALYRSLGLP